MPNYTPRLGLEIPLLDENLNDLPANWDRLDRAFAGVIWVTPGTVPDNTVLFDGAMIAEIGNGIVWRAQKNQAGGFDKKYIKYPWVISVKSSVVSPTAQEPVFVQWPLQNFDAAGSLNSTAADVTALGEVVCPVKGLYGWAMYMRWEAGDTTPGSRSVAMRMNGNQDNNNTERIQRTATSQNNQLSLMMRGNFLWDAGTKLDFATWRNSGGPNLQMSSHFTMALIRPL